MREKASYTNTVSTWICLFILVALCNVSLAQSVSAPSAKSISGLKQTSNSPQSFIENKGQYGKTMDTYESMGEIKFGYEGLIMPILFTPKGLIHLQRKIEKLSHKQEEGLEKQGFVEDEIERQRNVTDRTITMQWIGANENVEIIAEEKTTGYHTYGKLTEKAFGYKKIIYKNLYDGIDLVYNFINDNKRGFEYSIIAKAGANVNLIKMKFGGDVKKVKINSKGNLEIKSDIDGIEETIPVSYYSDKLLNKNTSDLKPNYAIDKNEIHFSFPQGYDSTKALVIDPFVTTTTSFAGANIGKAKDVDFDYEGNIYITGGGDGGIHQLAKYNAAGVLQWTFNGNLNSNAWAFGPYYGGWVVEKSTGNVYLGQGFNFAKGFIVVRIHTTGLYDNYISNGNPNFRENWKMIWNCNNGSPQILIAGGGTNSNINMGICTPPAVVLSAANITGVPNVAYQDMADMVIDPVTNSMYTMYAAGLTPALNNAILKHNQPYSAATLSWQVQSGYDVMLEARNRPYLAQGGFGCEENSVNMLAVNASYLYYWDGKNLKAFDKNTGATVGTPLTITVNFAKMQGGIVADACNNIFAGDVNGTIKVYKFNGSTFDDAAAPDISIAGFSTKSVYDLAYDESKKLLYASGDGFVASFDVSAYCPASAYTLNVVTNCVNASATVTMVPTPPLGSAVNYTLYNGTVQVAANSTGIFTGLFPNINYTVVATINQNCSGAQTTASFTIPGPLVNETHLNTTCGASTGSITITASGGITPYAYSKDGITFQASNIFTGLPAGIYAITVKDANGCSNIKIITILNADGPLLSFNSANATCALNTGTITANVTGGTTPYQYSINGTVYQSSNFFTGLFAGVYNLTVKDATGCINATQVTITTSPAIFLTVIPTSAKCGLNNGILSAFTSGGTPSFTYSINGNNFQVSNSFVNLAPGTYTLTVKDAIGCTKSATVTVGNSPPPIISATATASECGNVNGTITITGSGGVGQLQYSIDGTTFQTNNIFTGLLAGLYSVSVRDVLGCIAVTTVNVAATGGPVVLTNATVSSCSINNGTITATVSGGTGPYLYSITNGFSYQASNVFTGLAPGVYVIYAMDINGCIGTSIIAVGTVSGPSLTLAFTAALCNANTGTITATGNGGAAPLQYSLDGITYQASNIFTGLATGVYTVYVKDAAGCVKTKNITVANVSGLTLDVSTIVSSCNVNNGSISAIATGGVAPLQYSINGTNYFATNIFTGLGVGTYTVYVKDANNCIVTRQATVSSVSGPALTLSVQQNATCGGANGVVIATGNGGLLPLSYNMDGRAFQPSGYFVSVAAGIHNFIVKDATGCVSPPQTVTITNSGAGTPPTDVTFVINNVLPCTGGQGRIKNLKGVPNGGGNNYTFSLDGGAFTTANQFRPVPIGTHTITAMNQNGCRVTRVAVIGIGTPATATATATSTPCNTSNGTITIVGVGANVPYHASVSGLAGPWNTFFPPGANSFTFTGLAPGTYQILMADDADFTAGNPDIPGACITNIFATVPSTGGPLIATTPTNPSCNLNDGSITATGSGGTAPYTYSIDGGAYSNTNVFNNLSAGLHSVTVKDGTGCINGSTVTLANPSVPAIAVTTIATSCNINNGSITVNATGGTGILQYSMDGSFFQLPNTFTNLAPGTYTVYVKDINDCYSSITTTVAAIPLPIATAFSIAASCNNNDGSVVATGAFGETPYTFSINGTLYQSSGTFSGLAAGFYIIYLKDNSGCITTTGISVGNIGAPTISNFATTAATCGNPTGSITITATGGTPVYEYSKDGITFQTSNVFSGLLPGTYIISVRDANGCIATQAVSIQNTNGPQTLSSAVIDAACGLNNGSITLTATGGTGVLQYSKDGVTYQASNIFNGLAANTYTIFVRDANLCVRSLPVTVLNLLGPTLNAIASPASCGLNDGTITAIANGGTVLLQYSKDGITFQPGNVFTGLAAGPYTITVRDGRSCPSAFNINVVTAGISTIPTFNPIAPICSGLILNPLPTTSLNGITGTWAPALNNTTTTTYTFTPNGGQCATIATLIITVNPKPAPIIIYHN